MPSVNSAALTLTTTGQTVTLSVSYNAVFTAFERQLAGLGMTFHEHLDVFGIDPPGSLTGTLLDTFPLTPFTVSAGAGPLIVPRSVQMDMTRSELQEDTGVGDSDEIRVKIRIHSVGLPPEFSADIFTDQETLLG
jgi:hypothetical protein